MNTNREGSVTFYRRKKEKELQFTLLRYRYHLFYTSTINNRTIPFYQTRTKPIYTSDKSKNLLIQSSFGQPLMQTPAKKAMQLAHILQTSIFNTIQILV